MTWQRPGTRTIHAHGDKERGLRLYEALKNTRFWCDKCGALHPLIEHRDCRGRT